MKEWQQAFRRGARDWPINLRCSGCPVVVRFWCGCGSCLVRCGQRVGGRLGKRARDVSTWLTWLERRMRRRPKSRARERRSPRYGRCTLARTAPRRVGPHSPPCAIPGQPLVLQPCRPSCASCFYVVLAEHQPGPDAFRSGLQEHQGRGKAILQDLQAHVPLEGLSYWSTIMIVYGQKTHPYTTVFLWL